MRVLNNLEPSKVFYYFEELCKIPHGTENTKAVSDYCVTFAKAHGLKVHQDSYNDVVIYKDGTKGYEDSDPVILQGHLDMVCEKAPDKDHDFMTDGLDLVVDGDFVHADRTTLGGDDGIAIAMCLALLDDDTLAHPPLECLFTVDEETEMLGAQVADLSLLKGKRLINIDSEEEGIITAGCAGGLDYVSTLPVKKTLSKGEHLSISIGGLLGGHSGGEIHKQRGNAIILLGHLLYDLKKEVPFGLETLSGGQVDNVIPPAAKAEILVAQEHVQSVMDFVKTREETLKSAFGSDESGLKVLCEKSGLKEKRVFDAESLSRVLAFITAAPQGVIGFERALPGQVETSLNLGVCASESDSVKLTFLIRSSIDSRRSFVKDKLEALTALSGGTGEILSPYPAWSFRENSELRDVLVHTFEEMYGKTPSVMSIHAGLECGFLTGKRPDLDCVSIGPDLFDVHSPKEKLSISSTQRTWAYLLKVLEKLK